eukprot:scaffold4927_cov139-Amphora_coffeaeformis.AAC.18
MGRNTFVTGIACFHERLVHDCTRTFPTAEIFDEHCALPLTSRRMCLVSAQEMVIKYGNANGEMRRSRSSATLCCSRRLLL